jgi:tetratricopeptide (TPR) repeat protein
LATAVAYFPAIRAPFEFDDASAITSNASLRSLSPTVALRPPQNTSVSGRPVVNFTFAVNAAINRWLHVDERPDPYGPNKTLGYHIVNLLLHMSCGLLLFGLIRRTIARAGPTREWSVAPNAVAFVTVALWLLHPIHTEAVDYLVQRTEVLVSVCYAGTLYASIRAFDATTERRRMVWQVVSVVTCLLGMGSKEVMITAPIIVVLYDRAFRFETWSAQLRERRWFYLALAATALWTIVNVALNARFDTVGFGLGVSWHQYLYTQAWAVARYLRLMVWPVGLTLDYGMRPIAGFAGVPGAIVLSACFVATIAAWTRIQRWGWLAFLGAWFFLILAPSSSVVPIATEIAAERRVYLALASPIVLVVVGVLRLASRLESRTRGFDRKLVATFGVVILALGALTFERSALFTDPEALWRDAVKNAPHNPRAYDNLAATMFFTDPPNLPEAKDLYLQAVNADSTYLHAWTGLAAVAINEGQLDAAVSILQRALAIDSGYSVAFERLGKLHLQMGRPDKALPYLQRFATAYPSDNALITLGIDLLQLQRYGEAATAFRRALELNPNRVDAMRLLGGALVEAGKGAEAVEWLERLAAAQPPTPIGTGLLAIAYAQSGRPNEAKQAAASANAGAAGNPGVNILAGRAALLAGDASAAEQYFADASRADPRSAEAATFRGLALRQLGKSHDAELEIKRALAIDPRYQPALDALRR